MKSPGLPPFFARVSRKRLVHTLGLNAFVVLSRPRNPFSSLSHGVVPSDPRYSGPDRDRRGHLGQAWRKNTATFPVSRLSSSVARRAFSSERAAMYTLASFESSPYEHTFLSNAIATAGDL